MHRVEDLKNAATKDALSCEHGREPYYCVDCGGPGVCEHGRRHGRCKSPQPSRHFHRLVGPGKAEALVVGAGKPCGGVYYNADDEDPTTLMDDDYPEFLEQRIGKWRRLRYRRKGRTNRGPVHAIYAIHTLKCPGNGNRQPSNQKAHAPSMPKTRLKTLLVFVGQAAKAAASRI